MTEPQSRNAEAPPTVAPVTVVGGVFLAIALYAGLGAANLTGQSATFDEVIHLPPGYASLVLRDHRMNPDHPPLVRRIAALPLLFLDVRIDPEDHAWATARPWEWGKRFLFRWNDARRLLFWGRLPIIALGAVLAVSVFFWTWRLHGLPAAAIALFLFVLGPDMLAHGQIVTNDLGISLFIFLAVMAFERLTAKVTATSLLLAGLALGGALATKFSGVGLVPILGGLGLAVALAPAPLVVALGRGRPREVATRTGRLAVLGALLVAMGALALVVVWAAFGFRSPLAVDAAGNANFDWSTVQPENALAAQTVSLLRGTLLPEAWVWGFLHFLAHSQSRPAFLLGEYSETGWWYYFPVTFALKTPIPLLILVAAAVVLLLKHRPGWVAGGRSAWFVWLPVALFLAITMTRKINIGHRHLLPIYPFLFVAAGHAAAGLARLGGERGSALRRMVLGSLLAWYAVGTLRVHPHFLAYFNELGGGPANGYRRLVDSNLDWGQDLPALRDWMERAGVARLKLLYFGTADPGYYGVRCDRLPGYQPPPPSSLVRDVQPGDVVAVSATHLQGLYLDPEVLPLVERLRRATPLANVGYSIFVYRADFTWSLP